MKDIARPERSLRNEEGEDEYKLLKNKLNKFARKIQASCKAFILENEIMR